MAIALTACRGKHDSEVDPPEKKSTAKKTASKAGPPAESTPPSPANGESTGPRYLRPNSQGALVDAFQFPSVPAFIIEQEVGAASSRSDAIGVLRRFGLSPLKGKTGQVWMAQASLVDRLGRERVLVVSFRGEASSDGLRNEDGWIVFLGSTSDDRVMKIGNARITAKTAADTSVEIDARELHWSDGDDVVATWSSCSKPMQKACHSLRAWTMQRGYPELIVDVTGDNKPTITGSSPPYSIVVDDRTLKFDSQAFAYK
jgi:hypothetical protein